MSTTLAEGMTLYAEPRDHAWPRWTITIHRAPGGNLPLLVRFACFGRIHKQLDQVAAWLPVAQGWDQTRWAPNQHRKVPAAVLAAVEAAIRGGAA